MRFPSEEVRTTTQRWVRGHCRRCRMKAVYWWLEGTIFQCTQCGRKQDMIGRVTLNDGLIKGPLGGDSLEGDAA